jgi:hypothetical protein
MSRGYTSLPVVAFLVVVGQLYFYEAVAMNKEEPG